MSKDTDDFDTNGRLMESIGRVMALEIAVAALIEDARDPATVRATIEEAGCLGVTVMLEHNQPALASGLIDQIESITGTELNDLSIAVLEAKVESLSRNYPLAAGCANQLNRGGGAPASNNGRASTFTSGGSPDCE